MGMEFIVRAAEQRAANQAYARVDSALDQANNNIRICNATIRSQREQIARLQADLTAAKSRADASEMRETDLQLDLFIAWSRIVGLTAVRKQAMELHPDSELWLHVGTRADGSPLTKALVIYNKAFDNAALEYGIANPQNHRVS